MSETSFKTWHDSFNAGRTLDARRAWEQAQVWNAACESAATTVESVGCLCIFLYADDDFDGQVDFHLEEQVTKHDHRCPKILARQIREVGRVLLSPIEGEEAE